MPKTAAPISHDAIKRSLKCKFKLILSENRILVETINGYVRRAEKVYKEMDSSESVTPKQFAKAMEKLERAYSACVRLIMVASDLFEKGDIENSKASDKAVSSCDSETTVYSSESSTTITDTNRARKVSKTRHDERRAKSSDIRVNDPMKAKGKSYLSKARNPTIQLTDTMMGQSHATSERLFVRPNSSEFDHFIELQRFLHGLEREKTQTDKPSQTLSTERQTSYKVLDTKALTHCQSNIEQKQASPSECSSQSLTHRLKVLKSAIEHFKDRSLGDERVTEALNDIRELVLKSKETQEAGDMVEEVECKDGCNSQTSLASESASIEIRQESEQKHLSKEKQKNAEFCPVILEKEQNRISPTKRKQSKATAGSGQKGSADEKSNRNLFLENNLNQKNSHIQQQQPPDALRKNQVQAQVNQQVDEGDMQAATSPALSPQVVSEEGKDDINQIIVNRIVDMVSAKLAPRLQTKNGDTRHSRSRCASDSPNQEIKETAPRCPFSPQMQPCKDNSHPQNQQPADLCDNYNNLLPVRRHHRRTLQAQQQNGQHQNILYRQLQRPKMVSFVEDYESDYPHTTWKSRQKSEVSTAMAESPTSSQTPSPYLYSDYEQAERYQSNHNKQSLRFSSPHKKWAYTNQKLQQASKHFIKQYRSKQIYNKSKQSQKIENPMELEVDDNQDEDQVEFIKDTDSETIKDQSDYEPEEMYSKTSPERPLLIYRNRSVHRSPSFFETEYRKLHLSQQGSLCTQQQALHKTDSFLQRVSYRSPNTDSRRNNINDPLNEWREDSSTVADPSPTEIVKPGSSGSESVDRSHCKSKSFRHDNHHSRKSSSIEQHSEMSPAVSETLRQRPTKTPRSFTPQPPHISHHNSSSQHKTSRSDQTLLTPMSSLEASPMYTPDGQINNAASNCYERGGNDNASPEQTEVVCIDAMQLQTDASRTITLSNLPLDMEEKELLKIFQTYGQVTKIYYLKDRHTGVFQGRAYGKFSKASEAYLAAQHIHKLVINGHEINAQLYINAT